MNRPLWPPGAEIMAQAYEAFDAWCSEHDPDGDMDISELATRYANSETK
jgi:hypothetical protein